MLSTAYRSLQLIEPGQRRRWLGLVLLSVLSSGLEMLGAVLVYLLLSLVAAPGDELTLPLVGDVRSLLPGVARSRLLVGTAAAMAAFFVCRAVFQAVVGYLHARMANTTGARLASRLATGYLALPYEFHLRRNSSESIRNVYAASTQVVGGALLPLINIVASTVVVVGLLIVMVALSPLATGLAIVVIGAAALVLLAVIQPRLKWYGETAHAMGQRMLQAIQQALQGLRDIKLLGRERFFADRFAEGVDELAHMAYLRSALTALPRLVMETALLVFILLFFALSVRAGQASTQALSLLGAFAYVGLRVQPSLSAIVSGLNELRFASAVVDDIVDDLSVIDAASVPPRQPPRPFRERLELRDVTFRYQGADTPAIRGIDLEIARGSTVGLCGPTGGGKSTVVDLLTGLLTPTTGAVLIDGEDLGVDPRGWQRNLGVVPQHVFLVDDTIRRNIALGVDDAEVEGARLSEVVHLAQLEALVAELPDGLETVVGEGGVRLSGGQRQRIAIARALYRRAEVLVLDEGTSALDNATEARLLRGLQATHGERTMIMVAHRLSTVEACDQLVLIDGGRVRATGTYDELRETSPDFRDLLLREL